VEEALRLNPAEGNDPVRGVRGEPKSNPQRKLSILFLVGAAELIGHSHKEMK
jgi:hypothetical protein